MKRGEDLTDFMVINKELLKFKIEGPIQRIDTRACPTLEPSSFEFWERNLQKNQEKVSADENPTTSQPVKGQPEHGNEKNQHHSDSDERKRSKSPKKGSAHSQSEGTRLPPYKNYSSNHRSSKSKSYKHHPIRHNGPSNMETRPSRKIYKDARIFAIKGRGPPKKERTLTVTGITFGLENVGQRKLRHVGIVSASRRKLTGLSRQTSLSG